MMWPFNRPGKPECAEEVAEKSETVRAREAKKSALVSLVQALSAIEVERDLSDSIAPRKPKP